MRYLGRSPFAHDRPWLLVAAALHIVFFACMALVGDNPRPPLATVSWRWVLPFDTQLDVETMLLSTVDAPALEQARAVQRGATAIELERGGLDRTRRGARSRHTDAHVERTLDEGGPPGRSSIPDDAYDESIPGASMSDGLESPAPMPATVSGDSLRPIPAPTRPPAARRLTGRDVTALVEGDLLANDRELGLRQPTTQWLLAELTSELRITKLPNGTRLGFVVDLAPDGTIAAMSVTTQSAGEGAVGTGVVAAVVERMRSRPLEMGGYVRGAHVTIGATVLDPFPSGAGKLLDVAKNCPVDDNEGVARELRDIRAFHPWPQDPNQELPPFAPIGGRLYHARETATSRRVCPRLVFDMSDWATTKMQRVRTSVAVTQPPPRPSDE